MILANLITTIFLVLTVLVAIAPLFLTLKNSQNNNNLQLQFRIGWTVWILFWGILAIATTAQLQLGIPQRLRFPVLFILPVIIGSLLICCVKPIRKIVDLISLESLIKWQICRVIGGFFLIGALVGTVSVPFAVVSGLGDITVGITTWFALQKIKQNPDRATQIAKKHTWLGLADFGLAVVVALSTQAQIGFPYSMIPLFLVPIAILGHVATLAKK